MSNTKLYLSTGLILLSIALITPSAFATAVYWDGEAGDNNWSTDSNWTSATTNDTPPVAGDHIYIRTSGSKAPAPPAQDITVNYDKSSPVEFAGIILQNTYGDHSHKVIFNHNNQYELKAQGLAIAGYGTAEFHQSNGAITTLSSGFTMAGYDRSNGLFTISDASSSLSARSLLMGWASNSSAVFIQNDGDVKFSDSIGMGLNSDTLTSLYQLEAGTLSSNSVRINRSGQFIQNGGDATLSSLEIFGEYQLNGGALDNSNGENIYHMFTQTDGINKTGGLQLGLYDNGENAVYNLSGGQLINEGTAYLYDSVFNQSQGEHSVKNFYLGYYSGDAVYNLSGGSLSATNDSLHNETIGAGYSGSGTFNHSGGTNYVESLSIGYNSTGIYSFTGGSLNDNNQLHDISIASGGLEGTGTFIQDVDTHLTVESLYIGLGGGHGYYYLNQGDLTVTSNPSASADAVYIGSLSGTGEFHQAINAGTHTIEKQLCLGYGSGRGFYYLNGGNLIVNGKEHIGYDGTDSLGVFEQSGGFHHAKQGIALGETQTSVGEYSLLDGSLTVGGDLQVGYFGDGFFHQYGGTIYSERENIGARGKFWQDGGENNVSSALTIQTDGEYVQKSGEINAFQLNVWRNGFLKQEADGEINITGTTISNTGFIESAGALNGALRNKAHATLKSSGIIRGNVFNSGTILPGIGDDRSMVITGDLFLDPYPEATTVMAFELGGYQQGLDYDYIDIGGTASLAGTLRVSLLDIDFDPLVGSIFTLLHAEGGVTGTFSSFIPWFLGPDKWWEIEYGDYDVRLSVLGQTSNQPVPEPATFLLLGSGLLGLGWYGRKRKKS